MGSEQKRVMLWAVPRSLSTVMCRVMMNSGLSTKIFFEPYSVPYYLGPERKSTRYENVEAPPGNSYEDVRRKLELSYDDKDLVFAKDMPYFLAPERMTADWIPDGYIHTFVTRHPSRTTASWMKLIRGGKLPGWNSYDHSHSGFKEQLAMLRLLQDEGHRVIVLDSDDLMENPEGLLRAYCREVGLQYQDSMLNWETLSEADFQEIFCEVWEPGWFLDMKDSNTIQRRSRKTCERKPFNRTDPETKAYLEESVATNVMYYKEMHRLRLTV